MSSSESILKIKNEKAMLAFGAGLAKDIVAPAVIYLTGPLGAGKTTITRGFLRELGYQGNVKSPTYTLVESYQFGEIEVHHFDLYRIHDANELEYLGIREYSHDKAILLIEWPENAQNLLPKADIHCYIDYDEQGRTIKISRSF